MASEPNKIDSLARNTDYDALAAQLAALREDVMKLAGTATGAMSHAASAAGARARSLGGDVADAVGSAAGAVAATERAAQGRLEAAIGANPLVAIGLASVAGYLLGALTRR